jgi:NDP-mannose synthase
MKRPKTEEIKVVIVAGGKGTRLKPLTAVFPKPLVPLGNKPVIEILLRQLSSLHFRNITICTGYLAELVMAVCGDGSKFGLNINYSREAAPLGTAGPLGLVEGLTDPFMVMNGDLLTTLNFNRMVEFHREEKADFTLGVFPREVKIDFGVVERDGRKAFNGFREKPTYYFEVSMGVNVIGLAARQYIQAGQYLDMPDLILRMHQNKEKISCYREDCFWLDIGRMDDYALAQERFCEDECHFLGKK